MKLTLFPRLVSVNDCEYVVFVRLVLFKMKWSDCQEMCVPAAHPWWMTPTHMSWRSQESLIVTRVDHRRYFVGPFFSHM